MQQQELAEDDGSVPHDSIELEIQAQAQSLQKKQLHTKKYTAAREYLQLREQTHDVVCAVCMQ